MINFTNLISRNKVYFIGAGPGAGDLITIRGLNILSKIKIVLYDALVSNEILKLCPYALKILVGKRKTEKYITQNIINEYLIYYAYKYNIIVRLKCGDPMIFSRIDEELYILDKYNVSYEIVPGITAALAASSITKRLITKRGISYSVTLFTSSFAKKYSNKFKVIKNNCTLIQYMGSNDIIRTFKKLLSIGYSKFTPVIIVENCSCTNECILYLQLGNLKKNINNFVGPVIMMIGESLINR